MKKQRQRQRRANINQYKGPRSAPEGHRVNNGNMFTEKPNRQSDGGSGNAVDDDDIVAQLLRQRQKQTQLSKEIAIATTVTSTSQSPRELSPAAASHASRIEERRRRTPKCERSVGNFRYDPTLKRYFPKSAFAIDGNTDACIQRIKEKLLATKVDDANIIDERRSTSESEQLHRLGGSVTSGDIRRIALFRGSLLPSDKMCHSSGKCASSSLLLQGKKRKKPRVNAIADGPPPFPPPPFPCTERTKLLLQTSLEYCTSIQRRNAIVSMKLGPMSIARRACITPTLSTLEMLRNQTKKYTHPYTHLREDTGCDGRQQRRPYCAWPVHTSKSGSESSSVQEWFSMLHPLRRSRGLQTRPQQLPWSNDCECKSYLQPTAPTFDVIPSYVDRHSIAMPHIATISNDGIYYRGPSRAKGYSALKSGSTFLQYQGVRLATLGEDLFVGSTVHDIQNDQRNFALRKISNTLTRGGDDAEMYATASPVNDFCFATDVSLQGKRGNIKLAAFAHGGDEKIGASFLDIATGSYISIRDSWSKSEPLCVQFRSNNETNHALFGHRDGSASMIDTRSSKDALFLSLQSVSFGSTTSLQPLKKDDNLVAGKGSFGTCCVFDLRRMSNCSDPSRYQQSKLFELSIPDHLLHTTKSVRCTGLAIDPSESIAIAPFADHNDDIQFAIWDITTGALLRTLRLNGVGNCMTRGAGRRAAITAFCELSSAITPGYGMLCSLESDAPIITYEGRSWGVWYKTNSLINGTERPAEGGGIHHISFR